MKLNLSKDPAFIESFGNFREYGDGTMLSHWTGNSLEYVLFTPFDSLKKVVIDKDLLDKYKKEILGV